ncbi:MAG TPA: type III pantothenate kinase [Moorella mulderi]|nr:type III pantothenate kinase [Moorella mulderi]
MLLAVDIGNTQILLGLYQGSTLLGHWRLATDTRKTRDEYFLLLRALTHQEGFILENLEAVSLASVVPPLTVLWKEVFRSLGCPVHLLDPQESPLPLLVDNPREVGADRIANALAAHRKYGGYTVVVDFGTATTFDVISPEGEYLGGAIAPGIMVSWEALLQKASRLAQVDLDIPPGVIGKNTVSSLQSGFIFGFASLTEGMLERIGQELGCPFKRVLTGGLSYLMAPLLKEEAAVEPFLTLEGLRIFYEEMS